MLIVERTAQGEESSDGEPTGDSFAQGMQGTKMGSLILHSNMIEEQMVENQ